MTTLCPYITHANISIQGSGFVLYKVKWSQPPLGKQLVSVQYKKSIDATWLLATTNLQVDEIGNLFNSSFTILDTAELGVQYDVRLVNQCGSIEH